MIYRMTTALLSVAFLSLCLAVEPLRAESPNPYGSQTSQAYGRTWGGQYAMRDIERFYHYPYVYYPQNFWGNEYYRSSDSPYYRYPAEMRIPVYNKKWQNYYPQPRLHHQGHQFELDVF